MKSAWIRFQLRIVDGREPGPDDVAKAIAQLRGYMPIAELVGSPDVVPAIGLPPGWFDVRQGGLVPDNVELVDGGWRWL